MLWCSCRPWTWTWCVSESKSSNWWYRGRKLKLIYISPFVSKMAIYFRLKPANEHPEMISSSKIFHSFTTLLLKENFATSSPTLFLFNFNEWPRRLDCDISKNTSWSIFSYPLRIFKTSIKSPLNLCVSSVVKPNIFNLSSLYHIHYLFTSNIKSSS